MIRDFRKLSHLPGHTPPKELMKYSESPATGPSLVADTSTVPNGEVTAKGKMALPN